MTRSRMFVSTLCLGWLVASAAFAQGNDSPQPTSYFNHRAESVAPSDEVTVNGTIQQIVANHTKGAPLGTHVLLATSDGVVDASLGPYLTKDVQQSLSNGQEVQVVGVLRASGDQNYLLARQVVIGGKQITVRNEYGFFVRTQSAGSQSRRAQSNGGVQ